MKIKKLIENIKVKKFVNFDESSFEIDIKSICDNTESKHIKNSAFVCVDGFNFDSHQKSSKLQKLGVKFVVCEKDIETNLPYIVVESSRETIGALCDNFYNHPTKSFSLIGVVGTNGKTSTTYFIKQLADLNNIKCSVIGTSGVFINNKKLKETLTTPDPLVLYDLFDKARRKKSQLVVMEISAHAINLKKVANLVCDIVCFTNFSQDHLDFFKTMENYKQTKFSFFNKKNVKKAIINVDDDAGKELCEKIKGELKIKTFSLKNNADYQALNVKTGLKKTIFDLKTFSDTFRVVANISCNFNVYNLLCAVAVFKELGIKTNQNLFSQIRGVKGRFDCFELKNNNYIIIDYAHTPESLNCLLKSVNELKPNAKINIVFGCPGNRDETKREIMGSIAYNFCDKIYITSDNPKFENPLIICEEILKGAKEKGVIIENRTKAIKTACKEMKENEVLCIVGKGTEEYQDINNRKIKYCDYDVVSKCIKTIKKQ